MIAGIVIGCIFGLAFIVTVTVCVCYHVRKGNKKTTVVIKPKPVKNKVNVVTSMFIF